MDFQSLSSSSTQQQVLTALSSRLGLADVPPPTDDSRATQLLVGALGYDAVSPQNKSKTVLAYIVLLNALVRGVATREEAYFLMDGNDLRPALAHWGALLHASLQKYGKAFDDVKNAADPAHLDIGILVSESSPQWWYFSWRTSHIR